MRTMQPGWILFQKFFKILFTVPIPVIVSVYNKGRSPETGKASYIITNEAIDMKIESVEKTAKVIAALLKEKFPDVHFDVEAEYPNGEDQVVVRYTDGPSPVLVHYYIDKFQTMHPLNGNLVFLTLDPSILGCSGTSLVYCDWRLSPAVESMVRKAYEAEFHEPYQYNGHGFFDITSYYRSCPQLWPVKYQRLYEEQKKVPKEEPPVLKEKDDKIVSYEDFKTAALHYDVNHHVW